MSVPLEVQNPNTEKDVRDSYRAESVGDGACTPSISLLQMRGQMGTMRIVPCVKAILSPGP